MNSENITSNRNARVKLLSVLGLGALRAKSAAALSVFKHRASETEAAEINAQIKESMRSMKMLALVMPFAAVSGSTDTFFIITKAVASFIKVSVPL